MNKITAERNQRALLELASQPGNDVCADCKARNPRWASHNLGIFICMNCASIHRKMGTHISKVKSLTMDTWTKEQVENMKNTGNTKSNALYNPDETRHPPPTNMVDSERDSDLEKYIRSKYEFKSFVSRSAQVAAMLGPSRSASSRVSPAPPVRAQTVPVPDVPPAPSSSTPAVPPPVPPKTPAPAAAPTTIMASSGSQAQFRSVSQPVSMSPTTYAQQQSPQQQQQPTSSNTTWDSLMSLQSASAASTLPLQYNPHTTSSASASQPIQMSTNPHFSPSPNAYSGLSASPSSPFPSSMPMGQMPGSSPGNFGRSMSLSTGLAYNGSTGTNSSMNPIAPSPFASSVGLGFSTSLSTATGAMPGPPNPFAMQSFPTGGGGVSIGGTGMTQMQQGQQHAMSPFGGPSFQAQSSPFGQQTPMQTQSQSSPMYQTQPLTQPPYQMQMPTSTNPFMQQQVHTPLATQPQYGTSTASPFGQHPQQQQQMFSAGNPNPFAAWQGQQSGFSGHQWSGM